MGAKRAVLELHGAATIAPVKRDARNSITAVFGRRLRGLRRQKGLTQEEMGKRTNLDPKHVGGLERGEHGASFDTVQRIADALEVDFHLLFLPDAAMPNQLELSVRSIADDLEAMDPAATKQFFHDLSNAVRRLEEARRRKAR